ncbi:unnamed protein product [Amoebophrya sp. A25]|nr:unnamed protein product [Amoebophrya sp. A25]|eukprot:GSA25T00001276001.1
MGAGTSTKASEAQAGQHPQSQQHQPLLKRPDARLRSYYDDESSSSSSDEEVVRRSDKNAKRTTEEEQRGPNKRRKVGPAPPAGGSSTGTTGKDQENDGKRQAPEVDHATTSSSTSMSKAAGSTSCTTTSNMTFIGPARPPSKMPKKAELQSLASEARRKKAVSQFTPTDESILQPFLIPKTDVKGLGFTGELDRIVGEENDEETRESANRFLRLKAGSGGSGAGGSTGALALTKVGGDGLEGDAGWGSSNPRLAQIMSGIFGGGLDPGSSVVGGSHKTNGNRLAIITAEETGADSGTHAWSLDKRGGGGAGKKGKQAGKDGKRGGDHKGNKKGSTKAAGPSSGPGTSFLQNSMMHQDDVDDDLYADDMGKYDLQIDLRDARTARKEVRPKTNQDHLTDVGTSRSCSRNNANLQQEIEDEKLRGDKKRRRDGAKTETSSSTGAEKKLFVDGGLLEFFTDVEKLREKFKLAPEVPARELRNYDAKKTRHWFLTNVFREHPLVTQLRAFRGAGHAIDGIAQREKVYLNKDEDKSKVLAPLVGKTAEELEEEKAAREREAAVAKAKASSESSSVGGWQPPKMPSNLQGQVNLDPEVEAMRQPPLKMQQPPAPLGGLGGNNYDQEATLARMRAMFGKNPDTQTAQFRTGSVTGQVVDNSMAGLREGTSSAGSGEDGGQVALQDGSSQQGRTTALAKFDASGASGDPPESASSYEQLSPAQIEEIKRKQSFTRFCSIMEGRITLEKESTMEQEYSEEEIRMFTECWQRGTGTKERRFCYNFKPEKILLERLSVLDPWRTLRFYDNKPATERGGGTSIFGTTPGNSSSTGKGGGRAGGNKNNNKGSGGGAGGGSRQIAGTGGHDLQQPNLFFQGAGQNQLQNGAFFPPAAPPLLGALGMDSNAAQMAFLSAFQMAPAPMDILSQVFLPPQGFDHRE